MKALVGDIGNTVTKICLFEVKTLKIKKIIYFNSNNISSIYLLKKNLKKIIKHKNIYKIALFSSVVPKYQFTLSKYLKKIYKIKLREIKEKNIKKIVKINIKNKNQVGSDRIANAVGVYKRYKFNCIVLDFGTATTIDVVGKNHEYHGGVIYPGVQMSMEVLENKTAKLPSVEIVQMKSALGKSTIESIQSGLFFGQIGVVKELKHRITCEVFNNEEPVVLATGGFSRLFRSSGLFHSVIPDLALHGIHKSLKLNYQEG